MGRNTGIAVLTAAAIFAGGPALVSPAAADYKKAVAAYDAGDFKLALKELTALAEAGQANAEFLLGAMYFYGNGVVQNNALAAIWFHKAAIKGDPNGQLAFGSIHIRGIGVRQDLSEAYKWLSLAADRGGHGLRQQAAVLREQAAKLMTPREIASAQKSASTFTPKRAGLTRKN